MLRRRGPVDWLQSTLFQFIVTEHGLLIAAARDNAAANGYNIVMDPAGEYVGVVGGGGWRPVGRQRRSGYGVMMLAEQDFRKSRYFATGAYPEGAAVNPVTRQIVVVREKDARVYHLADETKFETIDGPFRGAAAWSGNGRFLLAAKKGGGLAAWSNVVTDDERGSSAEWWRRLTPRVPVAKPAGSTATANRTKPQFKPVPSLANFKATGQRDAIVKLLDQALAGKQTDRLPDPLKFGDYWRNPRVREYWDKLSAPAQDASSIGVRVYQARQAVKLHPNSPPLYYALGHDAVPGETVCIRAGRVRRGGEARLGTNRVNQGSAARHGLHARPRRRSGKGVALFGCRVHVGLGPPRNVEQPDADAGTG